MVDVLVPMDGSSQAESALEHALQQFPGARVTVIHAADPVETYSHGADYSMGQVDDWRTQIEERVESVFDDADRIASENDAEVETLRVSGAPSRAIVEYVDSEDVDHVVMGSHGRGGLSRVLLGSVAEKVVRRSPVPVTVIR